MPDPILAVVKPDLTAIHKGKIESMVLKSMSRNFILKQSFNYVNILPSFPQGDQVVTHLGKKFGVPKFRLKRRGGGAGIPESDAFWFEKEENKISLHLILEAYREENDVFPLNFKEVEIYFNYNKSGNQQKLPLNIIQTPLVNQINILKDVHATAEIAINDVQDIIKSISSPTGLDATITVNSTIYWKRPTNNEGSTTKTPPQNTGIAKPTLPSSRKRPSPGTSTVFNRIKLKSPIFTVGHMHLTRPGQTSPGQSVQEQKVNHQFTLNVNYEKNNPGVFGALLGSIIHEEYKWVDFRKLKDGETHTVYYRATTQPHTFCFLPQVFRIMANTDKGEPRISLAMHTDDKDDFAKYRVSLAIQIAPYFHPNAKKDLFTELAKVSNGTVLYPELTFSGYEKAKFILDPAYSGENQVLRGKITDTIESINPSSGFTLSIECNLESFDFLKKELINGITIGHVVFDLKQTTTAGEEVVESEKIPVELSLRKLTNLHLEKTVIETKEEFRGILDKLNNSVNETNDDRIDLGDKESKFEKVLSEMVEFLKKQKEDAATDETDEENHARIPEAPYGYLLSNIHNQEVEIGGIALCLISKVGDMVYDVDLDIGTKDIQWPLNLQPGSIQPLALNETEVDPLEGNNIWTHLQIEPYSIQFNKNPEAFINNIIDYATGDIETWDLTLDCGVFSNWDLLKEEDKAVYSNITDVGVQIKKPSGEVLEVVLSKGKPEKVLQMSRTLSEILNSQSVSDRKYQIRQKNYYLTREGTWSEWQDIGETSVNFKKIYPILEDN